MLGVWSFVDIVRDRIASFYWVGYHYALLLDGEDVLNYIERPDICV
jgi:hypothetical protein